MPKIDFKRKILIIFISLLLIIPIANRVFDYNDNHLEIGSDKKQVFWIMLLKGTILCLLDKYLKKLKKE